MTDLDKIILDNSNKMEQAWTTFSNQPYEMLAQANQMQNELNQEVSRLQFYHAIFATLVWIFGIIIVYKIISWARNTERHLKTISDAVQQKAETPNAQNAQAVSPEYQTPPESTQHSQPKEAQKTLPPQLAKAQAAPPVISTSEHPHSRYMKKD